MTKHFHIPELEFIPLDAEALVALLAGPKAFLKKIGDDGEMIDQVVEVATLTQALLARTGAQAPWICYLAQDPDTGGIVGTCGYKDKPTANGVVEIAYFTFPDFEGVGVGTGMAQELLARAFAEPVVNSVIAHTKGKKSASARVLEKVGMTCTGQVDHPEDGRVWRWDLSR